MDSTFPMSSAMSDMDQGTSERPYRPSRRILFRTCTLNCVDIGDDEGRGAGREGNEDGEEEGQGRGYRKYKGNVTKKDKETKKVVGNISMGRTK